MRPTSGREKRVKALEMHMPGLVCGDPMNPRVLIHMWPLNSQNGSFRAQSHTETCLHGLLLPKIAQTCEADMLFGGACFHSLGEQELNTL